MTEGFFLDLVNQERIKMLVKKGNLQVFGIIGSGNHQTSGDEREY